MPGDNPLLRACDRYRLTLNSWKVGCKSLAVIRIWMALEALTKVELEEFKRAHSH